MFHRLLANLKRYFFIKRWFLESTCFLMANRLIITLNLILKLFSPSMFWIYRWDNILKKLCKSQIFFVSLNFICEAISKLRFKFTFSTRSRSESLYFVNWLHLLIYDSWTINWSIQFGQIIGKRIGIIDFDWILFISFFISWMKNIFNTFFFIFF